jgi:hypothetical protein
MKKLIAITLPLALFAAAESVYAAGGTWSNVTVTHVWGCTGSSTCGTSGNVQVQLSAASTGGPSCASSMNTWVVIDVSTPGGAFAAALFQSAKLAGSTLNVYGIGNCNFYNGIETVGFVEEL